MSFIRLSRGVLFITMTVLAVIWTGGCTCHHCGGREGFGLDKMRRDPAEGAVVRGVPMRASSAYIMLGGDNTIKVEVGLSDDTMAGDEFALEFVSSKEGEFFSSAANQTYTSGEKKVTFEVKLKPWDPNDNPYKWREEKFVVRRVLAPSEGAIGTIIIEIP